jgi:isopropylmalate/homocitrate/citramalate synthase
MKTIKFSDFLAKNYENDQEKATKGDLIKALLIILAVVMLGSDIINIVDRIGGLPIGGR